MLVANPLSLLGLLLYFIHELAHFFHGFVFIFHAFHFCRFSPPLLFLFFFLFKKERDRELRKREKAKNRIHRLAMRGIFSSMDFLRLHE